MHRGALPSLPPRGSPSRGGTRRSAEVFLRARTMCIAPFAPQRSGTPPPAESCYPFPCLLRFLRPLSKIIGHKGPCDRDQTMEIRWGSGEENLLGLSREYGSFVFFRSVCLVAQEVELAMLYKKQIKER